MCGLAGWVDVTGRRSEADASQLTLRMSETLHHRGPDDSGVWADPDGIAALGHRRLSIIDLSPAGHQPMHSHDGRFVIAYNGEIYNFANIRAELVAAGEIFNGHSDTEVLLAAISRWGMEAALGRTNGMFALALWDRRDRTLSLARDRLGQKPLYYGHAGGDLVFASELKALEAHPDFKADVDRGALTLLMRHAYVPAPYSIYKGIFKLPAGCLLEIPFDRVDAGELPKPRPYWSAADIAARAQQNPFAGTEAEAADALDKLLGNAVQSCMVSDVPIGALLSGGIDSSTIVALMQSRASTPVKTFTIGFHEDGFDEAQHAVAIAQHLGTDHTELYLTQGDALDVIPSLPALYDEPFADPSQIPTYLVSKLAREQVTVSLSGDGGDELFGGYNRYAWANSIGRLVDGVPFPARRLGSAAMKALPVGFWDGTAKAASAVLPSRLRHAQAGDKAHKLADILNAKDSRDMYYRMVSMWQNPESAVAGGEEPETLLNSSANWPEVGDNVSRLMLLDAMTYMPDDILVKVDRAAMGVSLESRIPLLDHNVFEFAWRLPIEMKVQNGVGKLPLRNVLHKYVPEKMFARPKMGFGVPINSWLRNELRDWAEDLLDETRLKNEGFFNVGEVRRKWDEHLSGKRNWQYQLWAVLMAQAWLGRSRGRVGE